MYRNGSYVHTIFFSYVLSNSLLENSNKYWKFD